MTSFKYLLTLLSIVIVVTATTVPLYGRQSCGVPFGDGTIPKECTSCVQALPNYDGECDNALGRISESPSQRSSDTPHEFEDCIESAVDSGSRLSRDCTQCLETIQSVT
ncbi:hypothetical protein K439DRAFT_1639887 [Ramaria rubella]|nr:hypothetical protein K439DRAFT_1639887 [Ramaria rubella]